MTFLFTDIEGSTVLARSLGESWLAVLRAHHEIVGGAIQETGGVVVRTEGDAFFAAFATPQMAVRSVQTAQRALASHPWPAEAEIRVRMGLHTGAGVVVDDDYVGYEVHRAARVAAAGHGGQVLLSDATRALVADDLPEGASLRDLGEHRLKDVGSQRLHQLVIDGLAADFPPLRSLEPESTLPRPLSGFVGRERELELVGELLDSRLLTLTGPGGTGKTRLALEAARRNGDRFDAVYFVDLAAVTSPSEVIGTIATAVGAREDGGRSAADVLRDQLSGRDVLLVLDNFEQVLDAASDVADLLGASQQVAALVTSRSPLRLAGEQEFPVPPLGLPDPGNLPPIGELSRNESVALFEQRAKAVRPEFSLTDDVGPTVAAICGRLDGLPLAIELAASRLRSMSPGAILERLDRRLPLLTGGARDVPERQRTLRSTIAWSDELLDEPHRTLFARLSVLLGEWTLDAAEAVANPGGELRLDTLDALETLRDHALIRSAPDGDGGPWFSMLETIREYGLDRLAELGDLEDGRRHHASYFLTLAEVGEDGLKGPRAVEWRRRLDREHPNLRATLEWALETGDAETGLRVAAALWRFWQVRGTLRDGMALMDASLALPGSAATTAVRAKALIASGSLAYWMGDRERTRGAYTEALEIARDLEDERGIAEATYNLAYAHRLFGEDEASAEALVEALGRFHALGDRRMTAHVKIGLAMMSVVGGRDLAAGERLAADALATLEQVQEIQAIPLAHGILAQVAFAQGDAAATLLHTRKALGTSKELGDVLGVAVQLQVLAGLLGRRWQHERALRLAGAAERLKADAGGEAPSALIEIEDARILAAEALSEKQIRALLEEGFHATFADAVDLAVSELDALGRE